MYYVGGLYEVDEIDDWKKEGEDPDYIPTPINNDDQEINPDKEYYEIEWEEGKIVDIEKTTAKMQEEVETWFSCDGKNFKQTDLDSEIFIR